MLHDTPMAAPRDSRLGGCYGEGAAMTREDIIGGLMLAAPFAAILAGALISGR